MEYNFLDEEHKIKISKICLGTMTWGYQNSEQDAHEQIDYALTKGINFMDTAEVYAVPPSEETYGKTEKYIGTWIAKNNAKRKDIILASKMVGPGQPYIRGGIGLLAKDVETAIDGSLKRLQTDYIDLYQLHWPQRKVNYFGQYNYNPEDYNAQTTQKEIENILDVLRALDNQIKKGKIRHIGVSNETPWGVMQYQTLSEKHKLEKIKTIQNVYSLTSHVFDIHLSEVCLKEKVGLLAYSPLAGGLLSGKYRNGKRPEGARFSTWGFNRMKRYDSPPTFAAIEEYASIAEKHGILPNQLALAFVNERPFVKSNIIGATTMEHLKSNIDSINIKLNADIYTELEQVFMKYKNPSS